MNHLIKYSEQATYPVPAALSHLICSLNFAIIFVGLFCTSSSLLTSFQAWVGKSCDILSEASVNAYIQNFQLMARKLSEIVDFHKDPHLSYFPFCVNCLSSSSSFSSYTSSDIIDYSLPRIQWRRNGQSQ